MVQTISPQDAARLLAQGDAILIDVREADEFKAEHIAYASSLPLSNLKSLFSQMNIPVTRKVIFHCFKGKRGGEACLGTQEWGGCKNELYNLEGGITAWKEAGMPVISHSSSKISIFRQVQIIIGGLIALLVILGLAGLAGGFIIAGLLGLALFFAGLTGWCGLAMLLSKMPWNK